MQVDARRLQQEYERLVDGLAAAGVLHDAQRGDLANPALPQDILNEAVPGNIRRCAPLPTRPPARPLPPLRMAAQRLRMSNLLAPRLRVAAACRPDPCP